MLQHSARYNNHDEEGNVGCYEDIIILDNIQSLMVMAKELMELVKPLVLN